MSAERSTESIIDLLYGELSEEQEREVRAELAEAPDLQAEYDELDMMLGRVREAMPLEEVSPSIHASILEAARAAAEQPADDRLIRRAAPEKQSFWKRMGSGQGSQIALVAAVLIAGLFVVRFVEQSDSPLHAPASDISAMREAAPAAPVVERVEEAEEVEAPAEEAPAEEGLAIGAAQKPAPPAGGEAIADQWSPENKPADSLGDSDGEAADSLRNELARTQKLEERRDDRAFAREAVADPAPESEPEPVAKPAPKPRKRAAKKKSAPSRSTRTTSKDADSALSWDALNSADDRGSASQKELQVQGKAGLEAEEDAAPAAEYRPAPGSISEVDTYFRNGDYGGAVRSADKFLAAGSGSTSENASAMFTKAQALAKLGRTAQAERTLQQLKKAYPGWNSSQVEQQLSELQRRNAPKQQKKRKAKPKMDKSIDEPSEVQIYGE